MNPIDPAPRAAWQPFTFGGAAAFAQARIGRTLAVALALAIVDALLIFGAFRSGWLPVIDAAVENLPETGEVRRQVLRWTAESPDVLAASPLLQFVVDVEGAGTFGHESNLRVELRRSEFRLCGWLGCWSSPYPEGWVIALNRTELIPHWGAWRPFVQWGVFLAATVWLIASWSLIAAAAAIPLRLAAFYSDRAVTFLGCWRLAVAALQPGGLFLASMIFLYGNGRVNAIQLPVHFATHFIIGIVFMAFAVKRLPRVAESQRPPASNPFGGGTPPARPAAPTGGETPATND